MTNLNELFATNGGAPIDWHGTTVAMALELPIDQPVDVWLAVTSAKDDAGPQSLTVALRRRGRKKLGVVYEGLTGRMWRFWTDDPDRQNPGPVVCVPPTGGTELLVYNGWLNERREHEEFWGNHGIVIEPLDDGVYRLRCSRGGPFDRPPDFSSLIAEVTVKPADPEIARRALREAKAASSFANR